MKSIVNDFNINIPNFDKSLNKKRREYIMKSGQSNISANKIVIRKENETN